MWHRSNLNNISFTIRSYKKAKKTNRKLQYDTKIIVKNYPPNRIQLSVFYALYIKKTKQNNRKKSVFYFLLSYGIFDVGAYIYEKITLSARISLIHLFLIHFST